MKSLKIASVIVGAIIVTALGIDAADTITGSDGTLLSRVIDGVGNCPSGMIAVPTVGTLTCVDIYEVSASNGCPFVEPENVSDTSSNIRDSSCTGESLSDRTPWRFISREQASVVCAKSKKRLLTASEWYNVSLGTSDDSDACNLSQGSISETGSLSDCRSAVGVFDTVGNAWEWVSDDVFDQTYNGRRLPNSGYVTQVGSDGIATVATSTPDELHGVDYFWSLERGVYGMIRGGFYNSGSDGGVFTVHADTPPTSAGVAIGFRCGF